MRLMEFRDREKDQVLDTEKALGDKLKRFARIERNSVQSERIQMNMTGWGKRKVRNNGEVEKERGGERDRKR